MLTVLNVLALFSVPVCGQVHPQQGQANPGVEACTAQQGGSDYCTGYITSHMEVGESLLQVKSGHTLSQQGSHRAKEEELPDELYELGKKVFHDEQGLPSEQNLRKAMEESQLLSINYAGVPIVLRVFGKDNAAERLGHDTEDGQEYGFESLLESHANKDTMVNMIDMGGNYGAVTIAFYQNNPGTMRTVIIEPIAVTYFFLRWNLWLNQIPVLSPEDFQKDTSKPGVVALYGGVTEKMEDVKMCSHREWSMNAHFVADFDAGMGCDCSYMDCTVVPGITTDRLLDDFFKDATVGIFKIDCEGCENHALTALAKRPEQVKHLVGELHVPEEHLIDTACLFDDGKYMTKVCRLGEKEWASSLPLGCNQDRKKCAF